MEPLDTRAYVKQLIAQDYSQIVVRCDDTDVFLLLLYFYWKWKPEGLALKMKKSDGKYIDINASAENLGDNCKDLLGMHAVTGCDTVSYPFRRGKCAALSLLKNHDIGLHFLGDQSVNMADLIRVCRKFFCLLYGASASSMNTLRYNIFTSHKSTPRIQALPPTDEAFVPHVLRAHLQVMIWKAGDTSVSPSVTYTTMDGQKQDQGHLTQHMDQLKLDRKNCCKSLRVHEVCHHHV